MSAVSKTIAFMSVLVLVLIQEAALAEGMVPADTVFLNTKAYTLNQAQPWAEAVGIKDNKIVFVGSVDDARSFIGDNTLVKDLDGKMLLPGFIDAHAHLGLSGLFSAGLKLSATENREKLLQSIKAYAEKHPELPVIYGKGWPSMMFGEVGPQKEYLDDNVPDRPVILLDAWGHSAWLNSKALSLLGIDSNTQDPVPGIHQYQRDQQGNPTGWLIGMQTYAPAMQGLQVTQYLEDDIYRVIHAYSMKINQLGITTLFDAGMKGFEDALYPLLEKGIAAGDIRYRIVGAYHVTSASNTQNAVTGVQRLARKYNSDRLKVTTVKVHQDGLYEAYSAGLIEDYAGRPGFNGSMILNSDQVKDLVLELEHAGLDFHVHSIGDRTTRETLNGIELAIKYLRRPLASRITLSHLEFVDDEDFSRFKALGVIANITPSWHNDGNGSYVENVGKTRAEKVLRVMPLIDQETVVSASSNAVVDMRGESESAVALVSPLVGIESAYTRQALGNANGAIMLPLDERIPLKKMIEAYTMNGAVQLGLEKEIGSLEVGKRADLVVLDKNLFDIDKYQIHQVKVEMTVMDGGMVYCSICN